MPTNKMNELIEEIIRLKKQRNAMILAHVYQVPEIQDIADFVGDSLELSRQAAATNADVIVFCGVHFMAETASILSPDKIVLLPEPNAGCPMADMVTAEAVRAKKKEIPNAVVVSYINTPAEVKAESDICCTSANAVKVIHSLSADRPIIFLPDKNLGTYVSNMTGRPMMLWPGWCNVHEGVLPEDVLKAKARFTKAKVLVHPECQSGVIAIADYVSGTSGLIRYAEQSSENEFIIVTENGVRHQMKKRCPGKQFYLATEKLMCPNMKATTLDKVKTALETLQPQVVVSPDIRREALVALDRMLSVG